MSATQANGIATTKLIFIDFDKDHPKQYTFVTPKYNCSISALVRYPTQINEDNLEISWKDSTGVSYDEKYFDNTTLIVNGAMRYLNITLTTTQPTPAQGTKFWVTIKWVDIAGHGTIESLKTEIKLRLPTIKQHVLRSGSDRLSNDYPVILGQKLHVICIWDTNAAISQKDIIWLISNDKGKSYDEVTFDGADCKKDCIVQGPISMRGTATEWQNILTILTVTDSYHENMIMCNTTFSGEDGSFAVSSNAASVYILKILVQPNLYGFQSEGQKISGVSVTYQNMPSSELSYFFRWCTSKDEEATELTANCSIYEFRSEDTITELTVRMTEETSRQYWWAVLNYTSILLMDISNLNSLVSEKSYIVVTSLCSSTEAQKFSGFPVTKYTAFNTEIEVGDLIYVFGTTNTSFPRMGSTFTLHCENESGKLIEVLVDGSSNDIYLTKYSSDCLGNETAETTGQISYSKLGITELIMVATEKDFVTWTRASTKRNYINVMYTIKTNATETEPATYEKDYLQMAGITPYKTKGEDQMFTVQGVVVCPTERGQKMLLTEGVTVYSSDRGITGIPSIQWINEWGVICADGWDAADATVYCDQLQGYGHGGIDMPNLSVGIKAAQDVWVTQVGCSGYENSIYNCSNSGWDLVGDTCDKKNYAGAHCFKEGYSSLKIVGDYNWVYENTIEGIVMVEYNGMWGVTCGKTAWGRNAATAVCTQMGMGYGSTKLTDLDDEIASFLKRDKLTQAKILNVTWTSPSPPYESRPLIWLDEASVVESNYDPNLDWAASKAVPYGQPIMSFVTDRPFKLSIGAFGSNTNFVWIKFLDSLGQPISSLKIMDTSFTLVDCATSPVVSSKTASTLTVALTKERLVVLQGSSEFINVAFGSTCPLLNAKVFGWKIDKLENELTTHYTLPMVVSHVMDYRLQKGFWGRGLTTSSRCHKNETIRIKCTPLLVCWNCTANSEKECFMEENLSQETCNMNVLQCYILKSKDKNGKIAVRRGCGRRGSSAEANINSKTCEKYREQEGCSKNGKVCFCRNCFGRLCNDSPIFKAAQLQMKAVRGTIQGISSLVNGLSTLLRAGMFDATLARVQSRNNTVV